MNFSSQEYAERLSKTRQAMDQRGIELLLVTDPSNMAWLTGYERAHMVGSRHRCSGCASNGGHA